MAEPVKRSQFLESLQAPAQAADVPAWLRDLRASAAAYLQGASLPSFKDENWKYTNLSILGRQQFALMAAASHPDQEALSKFIFPEDVSVVMVNGRFDASLSNIPKLTGIRILTGREALTEPALKEAFSLQTPNDPEIFIRLNETHCQDLLVIDIARNADVKPLIHILNYVDDQASDKAVFPRVFVRLRQGSRAFLFETTLTTSTRQVFVNSVTDIRLDEGASLEAVQAFLHTSEAFHVTSTRIVQARDSRARMFQFTNGAQMLRNNLSAILVGEGAEAWINGLHDLKDERHADSHTFIEHVAPNAKSNQLYKSILAGQSRSVFNGRVVVRREAQKTNSYQLNKNLILSREARVDTKPQLEIFADDVKCTHGATIGQLDEDQVFYLATRGISKETATSMLIRGFVDDVISQVQEPALKTKLTGFMAFYV